ncbi:LmeA family phospholipid-binding protein [Pseudonocardia sp. TRM90224]|uniref:LmeA family phospholipid-binding protein n=1 Tax=Pseudonocardia sp. TRM90224 TaxID=2812678 RepID=UPI001E3C1588|nr:DUF2993 domain-containing protein [Pseudonocardia sp. TRM90224]
MRRLIIAVLVLAGLLVAADFGAAALAESAVSRQMREQIGLDDDPSVRINGFPFLTQAISGQYGSVDVVANRIKVGELKSVDVTAQLREVDAPLSMLLGSGPKSLVVGEAEGTIRIPAKDLETMIPGIEDLRIETIDLAALEAAMEDGGDETLSVIDTEKAARLVGTTTLMGKEVEVSVIAVLQLVDKKAQIVPRDIRLGGTDAPPLPATIQRTLQKTFTVTVDPGSLPLKVVPIALRADNGALVVSGVAENLTLGAAATTNP